MSEYFRPTLKDIVAAVAREFDLPVSSLPAFERGHAANQAKIAVAMIAREYSHPCGSIADALQRRPNTIVEMATEARELVHRCTRFKSRMIAVRAQLHAARKRKPVSAEIEHIRKLEKHKAEIMRLRHLHGIDKGWSDASLSRHFGIPVHILAPVLGVYRAER